MSDNELLEKFINNDPAAWTKIYKMFYRMVWYIISKDIPNRADVEELANDVFVRIKGNCNEIATIDKLKALLLTATRNVIIDYYRKQETGKIIKTEEYDATAESLNDHERNRFHENEAERLELILNEINKQPKQRRKIIRLFLEGFTVKEIAEKLGLSEWTVYNHIKAVKKDLKEKLGDQLKNYGLLLLFVFLLQILFL